jgi:hypothetical protein
MRICVDVCVNFRCELELWRAGYKVPVRACNSEPDPAWIARALSAGCQLVITADRWAAAESHRRGMFSIYLPRCMDPETMTAYILDAMEEIELRREPRDFVLDEGARPRVASNS